MAVTANFIGNPLLISTNTSVLFTDISTGAITSWDWDFGDGSPHSNAQNPTYTYVVPGTYTVTLLVSDGLSSDSISKPGYLTVYKLYEDAAPQQDRGGFIRVKGPTLIFD